MTLKAQALDYSSVRKVTPFEGEQRKINRSPTHWHYNLPNLTPPQKKTLLRLARAAMTYHLQTGHPPEQIGGDPMLTRCAGAFVTLWQAERAAGAESEAAPGAAISPPKSTPLPVASSRLKRLRGCIGHVWPDTPLCQVVQDVAIGAATRDPRLQPLTLEELADIRIEISVLSPLHSITDIEQIQVGVHGLMMIQGKQRGLLLPQVPVDRNWDRDMFLKALCFKAGLSQESWPGKAILYAFTALKFGE